MNKIKKGFGMAKECVKEFVREEDGVGIVEVILILVILIGMVALFHEKIGPIVKDAMDSIEDKGKGVLPK